MNGIRLGELGRHLASRARARELREDLLRQVANGMPYEIDLTNVLSVSDSFADELFAVLAQRFGDEWFREHVRVTGACDVVRGSIVRAIRARLERGAPGNSESSARGYQLADPPDTLEASP